MSFVDAVKTCLRKYATFNGTATRPEYWWFVLFNFLGSLVFSIIGILAIRGLWSLALLLPSSCRVKWRPSRMPPDLQNASGVRTQTAGRSC